MNNGPSNPLAQRELFTYKFRFPITPTQTLDDINSFFRLFSRLLFVGEGMSTFSVDDVSAGKKRPRKLVVVLNPVGGYRDAKNIYEKSVKPMLEKANIEIDYHGLFICVLRY